MAAKKVGRIVNRLFFDIETIGLPNAMDFIETPQAKKNLKDPAKIAADIEAKTAKALDKAGLDPDLGSIRLISMRIGVYGDTEIILIPAKKYTTKKLDALRAKYPDISVRVMSEEKALEAFWGNLAMCNGCNVGYNQLGFDFPFIMRRSMDLGVEPGITPQLSKYRDTPTTDLMGILSNWQWGASVKSLKVLAKRYEIGILAADVDGSMVAEMSDEDLVLYGWSDIQVTVELYKLANGIYYNHILPEPVDDRQLKMDL
jgi:hypothetical protein